MAHHYTWSPTPLTLRHRLMLLSLTYYPTAADEADEEDEDDELDAQPHAYTTEDDVKLPLPPISLTLNLIASSSSHSFSTLKPINTSV